MRTPWIPALVVVLLPMATAGAQNLFVNGGFETGTLAGWSEPVGATIVTSPIHSGTYACRLSGPPGQGAQIRQAVPVQPGQAYRATVWVYIVRTDIVDWGYIGIGVTAGNWTFLDGVELLASTHPTGQWFKVALQFTALDGLARFDFNKFANPASHIEFYVDDAVLLPDDGTNLPPQISAVVTPAQSTTLPATVQYALLGDDLDGAIEHISWDFGDGGHALDAAGSYTYVAPGTYTVRAYAQDDRDAVALASTVVTVSDPTYPTLTLTTPPESFIATTPTVALGGTAAGAAEVRWSTDRGEAGVAPGLPAFAATVPLHPGRNRILVNALSAAGKLTLAERVVWYHPPGPLTIVGVQHPPTVERWEPLVISFDVQNTRATTFDFPYDPAPPPGVPAGIGISVDAEFSDDGFTTVLTQPAFYYRGYTAQQRDGAEWLYPSDERTWMVRFAPPRIGPWQVRLRAVDAGGTALSPATAFFVTPPADPNNHGFVRVNPLDPRYFRFEDGTHFAGVGHGGGFGDEVMRGVDETIALVGSDSADFFRLWLSGANIYGSAWIPWSSRTLSYEGTVPATGLSAAQAYGDGCVTTRLDATNPLMFAGFQGGDRALEPGRTYRLRIRAKLVGVTGPARSGYPYGLTLKRTGWPDPPDFLPQYAALVPHVNGSRGWCVYEGGFVADANFLGNLCVMLENTTGGAAFVDEISLREVRSGGQLGPELLRRPNANYHLYFDPLASFQYDYALRQSSLAGHYYRLVITEKQDYILTRLGSAGFMERNSDDANFNAPAGHPSNRLQQYWWRYLTARWGAERSVHSWELANEQNPFSTDVYEHAERLAAWMAANDPHRHMASTSLWATFPAPFWANPAYPTVSPADVHEYVAYGTPENSDSALAHLSLARQLATLSVGKPIIRGETGLGGPNGNDHPALTLDTQGVWLRHITWAQLDAAVLYELYWWTDNIRGVAGNHGPLYHVYRAFRTFVAEADPGGGACVDAQATTVPALRVVGQVSTQSRRGHLWIQNRQYTWRSVVDGVPITPVTATVTVPGLPAAATYRVRWFDTAAGVWTTEQLLTTTADGRLLLPVVDLASDTAVLFGLADRPGDIDRDGDVDVRDFDALGRCLVGPGVTAPPGGVPGEWFARSDLADADGDVDLGDFAAFQRLFTGP